MTGNQIAFWGLQESKRHNLAVEAETHRYNVEYMGEVKRHNTASEVEINRHNLATESEAHRSNVANEAIRKEANQIQDWYNRANIGLGYSQLAYQRERDSNQLAYQYAALDETHRSNVARENLQRMQHVENVRHNKVAEAATVLRNQQDYYLGLLKQSEDRRYHDQMAGYNDRLAAVQEARVDIDRTRAAWAVADGTIDSIIDVSAEIRRWLYGSEK